MDELYDKLRAMAEFDRVTNGDYLNSPYKVKYEGELYHGVIQYDHHEINKCSMVVERPKKTMANFTL